MVPGSWSGSGGLQSPPEAGLGEGLGGEGGREGGREGGKGRPRERGVFERTRFFAMRKL